MNPSTPDAKRSIRRRRGVRFAFRLNLLVSILLAATLWGMANYLGYRYYARWDISSDQFYQLSDKTHALLDSITNDVAVTLYLMPTNSIYRDMERLLEEYEYACDRIRVDKVDPHRDLMQARELEAKHGLTEPGVLVFESGERAHVVNRSELVRAEYQMQMDGQAVSRTEYFLGEAVCSSALREVTQGRPSQVYVLQGHGEGDFESYDEFYGFSEIAQRIRRDHVNLRPLLLGERRRVPEDADALIIPRPSRPIPQPELDLLQAYLENSGRLLLLLEPKRDAGLRPLLEDWGIQIYDDLVLDGTRFLSRGELVVTAYGRHPITESLSRTATIFYGPRSVEAAAPSTDAQVAADRPRVVSLAATSQSGWAEMDLGQNPATYDIGIDRPGPVSIAVAMEKGTTPAIDVELPPTRMVVFGDSDFIANGALSGGNADLLLNSLNWLLERKTQMAISPKPFADYRLTIGPGQRRGLLLAVVAMIPGAAAVLGGLVWAVRRI